MVTNRSLIARACILAAALLVPATAHGNDAAATFRALLAQYRCAVVDRLEQIYRATDFSDPQNWFLIVSLTARPHDYVQCVFDTRTRMLCEAASGFYYDAETVPRSRWLPADAVAALGRLGFSTDDSNGNFVAWLDVAEPPDLGVIAEFLLQALHDGYAARADDALDFEAPLAPHASEHACQ